MVRITKSDRERVQTTYHSVAGDLVGKAALTLTSRGRGKVLLIGPHPELCGPGKRNALANLVAVIRNDYDNGTCCPSKKAAEDISSLPK